MSPHFHLQLKLRQTVLYLESTLLPPYPKHCQLMGCLAIVEEGEIEDMR